MWSSLNFNDFSYDSKIFLSTKCLWKCMLIFHECWYKKMELKCVCVSVCVCSVNKANIKGQNMNKTLLLFVKWILYCIEISFSACFCFFYWFLLLNPRSQKFFIYFINFYYFYEWFLLQQMNINWMITAGYICSFAQFSSSFSFVNNCNNYDKEFAQTSNKIQCCQP